MSALLSEPDGVLAFEVIRYPGWRRCSDPQCTGDMLVADLSNDIELRIPSGPIRIVGLSLGGHFAYVVANHLEAKGRQVEAVCAIDFFIVNTTEATPGWQQRAFFEFLELVAACDLPNCRSSFAPDFGVRRSGLRAASCLIS